jgi:hypothetical protein
MSTDGELFTIGQLGPVAGQRGAELGLGQGQGPGQSQGQGTGVFVADGSVEQPPIPQAHRRRDVSEQRHQRLQRAAGVENWAVV